MNGEELTQNGHATSNGENGHANGLEYTNGVTNGGKPGGYYSVGANPPPAWSNCKNFSNGLIFTIYKIFSYTRYFQFYKPARGQLKANLFVFNFMYFRSFLKAVV